MLPNGITEAQDWLSQQFKGKTIYDGHPLDTIGKVLELFPELVESLEGLISEATWTDSLYVSSETQNEVHELISKAKSVLTGGK